MDINPNHHLRFVYFYFNRNQPEKIREVAPAHVQYWKTADLKSYSGGSFADRSGGLISFAAQNLQEAMEIILRDPFVQQNLIEQKWIKEWIPE
jgi:uncharacterized protein YciI